MDETLLNGLMVMLGILLTKGGDFLVKLFRERAQHDREERAADARVDARTAKERRADQELQSEQYLILITTLQNQVDSLIAKLRTQDEKIDELRDEHVRCLESNAELTMMVKMQEQRIKKLEGEVPK